ncbi:MAG: DUF3842 family protein [Bacteroidales bacterium]|nr:DUF3842 family protein [Bacteroidales bacterium]
MNILVIDGQGGRVGKLLVEQIRQQLPDADITAVGTNVIATSAMLKAGANQGATGENPVIYNCQEADVVVGPIGIVMANSLLGEITPVMAQAIGQCTAHKILVPVSRCRHTIVGMQNLTMSEFIQLAVAEIKAYAR